MKPASDVDFMQRALLLAQRAAEEVEVPVGALLVLDDEVIGEGWNQPIAIHDLTAHVKIVSLRAGTLALQIYPLAAAPLNATLEPYVIVIGASQNTAISRLMSA